MSQFRGDWPVRGGSVVRRLVGRMLSRSRRPMSRAVLVAGICVLTSGCGSLRPIDPASGPVDISKGEGLIALHVVTDIPLESIQISGFKAVEDVESGDHVILLAATPGSYVLESFTRKVTVQTWIFLIFRGGRRVRFDVQPGRINYPGMLLIEGDENGGADSIYVYGRIVNRTAMLLEDLEKRFPDLVDRYPLRYAAGRDRFADALAEARAADRQVDRAMETAQ